jgi:uncharacterized membrane protein
MRTAGRVTVEAAPRDWLVAACGLAGLLISGYLTFTKLTGSAAAFCEAGTGCDIVQASRYATFLGAPTAAWGALLYAAVIALALVGLSSLRWLFVFGLATVAVSFSAYMTYLALVVLRAACPWCLLDALVAVALLGVTLWHRPVPKGRRAPTRTRRVVAIGMATAILTVVVAAGVFVAASPTAGRSYQENLARHLASSGAIFYGAYW